MKSVRLPYEQAVLLRPLHSSCYCDNDDRTCYELGHWEAQVTPEPVRWHQREASGLVTLVALALFMSACSLALVVLR